MNKLTILVGLSGSGKSTYTKQFITENPNTIIINRDSLRESLTGIPAHIYNKKPNKNIEMRINNFQENVLKNNNGYNVIVDNTNLKVRYINMFINIWNEEQDREREVILIDTPLSMCKLNIHVRDNIPFTELEYLDKQYLQLQTLKQNIKFDKIIKI